MMQVLERGYKVRMVPAVHSTFAVDTPADLKKVEAFMQVAVKLDTVENVI